MDIFTVNFLDELPKDIYEYIIKLSKKEKCNIVYKFENDEICFINHLITDKINKKILNFEYTLKDIEYDIEDEKYKYFYDKYLCVYHLQVLNALQEYINKIVSNYPIKIIRKIMFTNLSNKEIEELFKEKYPKHYDKIKRKKGCYIRGYYALMLGTAYCYNWNMQKII
ncbi:MAG: hypothetical protein EBZ69_01260 [Alphaproteobacteria bacterium]|jgi:hypothetical protein|nr:hypothetical protein [Alphaproteobacteria bacterium]